MADLTIAQLTELLAVDVDNADLLPIWDDTASETKKITIAQITTLFGLTNWSEAFITGTQDTSQWTPNNAAANVNAALTPKGTGAIVGQAPDGTSTGGNARGQYAVDFQLARSASNQVSSGSYSFIGSGANNRNLGDYSAIVGGYGNYLAGLYSFVGSGYTNSNQSSYAVIGGGESNSINLNNNYSVIGGGFTNATSETATYATIGGGSNNTVLRTLTTISGGLSNYISGNFSAIAGGQSNTAQGTYSFIGGGLQNTTSANYTAAMGRRAAAGNIGAFVWADSTDAQYNDNGANTFNVRATGGAYFTQYGYFGGRIDIQTLSSTAGLLRIFSNNSTNFIGLQAPNGISANYTYTLPTSYGTNGQVLTSNGSGTLSWSTAGGLTNWTEAFSSATQATSSFTATNAATDVNAAFIPKGTGALLATVPDGTTTGGNARGLYAIDLQIVRANANQVVSSASNKSAILGGQNNRVGSTQVSDVSVIVGGSTNLINCSYSGFIGGGDGNTINSDGWQCSILGGGQNSLTARLAAAIIGGNSNSIGSGGDFSIVGGRANTSTGESGFIGSGRINTLSGTYATIAGGYQNTGSGGYSFIGGGRENTASNSYASVSGGYLNQATNTGSTVGGGVANKAQGQNATVAGGYICYANGQHDTVGGGESNQLLAIGFGGETHRFIGGGYGNGIAAGSTVMSGIVCGRENTVGTGAQYSLVTGGYQGKTSLWGQLAHSSGGFAAAGDAQSHELVWRIAITGTAQTELFLDGGSVAAVLPATNCLWQGTVEIAAICTVQGNGTTPVGNSQGTTYKVTIKRIGTTTSLVGTVQEIGTMNNDAGIVGTFTIDANDTNESLRIQFTPPATAGSTTVHRVVATFRGLQIQY